MGWLDGKVALITGASAGIGRAVAERFVAEGAQVAAMARTQARIEALAAQHAGSLLAVAGDVTNLADNLRAVDVTMQRFGRLDVFVGNAGIFDCFVSLTEIPAEKVGVAFDEIFAVNVKGSLLGAKAAIPALVVSKGCMIFSVSNAGFYPGGGGPIYTASKHALVGLVRQLAQDLAPDVRVNGVAPGGTTSELAGPPSLADFCRRREAGPPREEIIRRRNPLRRAWRPEDHCAAYVLLASNQSPAMTGTIVESDGGIGVRGNPVYE